MKPTKILLSALSLLLATAFNAQSTEDASWGQVKAQITRTEDGRTLMTFSPAATRGAAKVAQVDPNRTVTKTVGRFGNIFSIKDDHLSGDTDDLRVTFAVLPTALDRATDITMTVYGSTIEDLVVEFAPAGLEFNVDAQLLIRLGPSLVNMPAAGLTVWHEHGDGQVEEAGNFSITDEDGVLNILGQVPGFSRYSMGGGGR